MHYENPQARLAPRRSRRWLYLGLAVVILVAGWTAFWFYAADRANQAIAGWLEREARLGRVYSCGTQSLRGFPFRIEVRCANAGVELHNMQPPLSVRLGRRSDRRANLSADAPDRRMGRPDHDRRTGAAAEHDGDLDADADERARPPARAGTHFNRGR